MKHVAHALTEQATSLGLNQLATGMAPRLIHLSEQTGPPRRAQGSRAGHLCKTMDGHERPDLADGPLSGAWEWP
jgi:hypothetical protein